MFDNRVKCKHVDISALIAGRQEGEIGNMKSSVYFTFFPFLIDE